MSEALWYRWNGAAMIPMRPDAAAAQFFLDGRYLLEAHHERSHARHKAYFAAIASAWHSLPEETANRHPSPEHLRKYALIRTGWAQERTYVAGSAHEAQRIEAFIEPFDSYAIIAREGHVVRVWTARSQSYKAMGRDDFNRSMDDVLSFIADQIGVSRATLEEQGEMA
jgi:hypothetical protein